MDKNRETANIGLVSSVGRAPTRQSGGRRFKSRSCKFVFVQLGKSIIRRLHEVCHSCINLDQGIVLQEQWIWPIRDVAYHKRTRKVSKRSSTVWETNPACVRENCISCVQRVLQPHGRLGRASKTKLVNLCVRACIWSRMPYSVDCSRVAHLM